MGNKLGGQKTSKPKEEKKREKEHVAKREKEDEKTKKKTTKKEKKENKLKKKEKTKKADGKSKQSSSRAGAQNSGSELDTDLESSHMTGWDSESGVFHSAENISSSPYLDSHTRSELEHSGTWSSLYESSTSRHPHVLSSRDFRDGFSLEACIPPEIARRDTAYHDQDGTSGGGGSGSNVFSYSNSGSQKSKRSNSSKSSRSRMTPTSGRHHVDDRMSVSTSSSQKSGPVGREGYSTPLLTTPVFGRVDRSHSPISPGDVSSALSRVHEADRNAIDIVSFSKSPFDPNAKVYTTYNPPAHLAHLYQRPSHTIDYRNLPKPTSPHPQRRALSPKMTSPSFKLISSDDSSSTPSTPVPQRKAGNIVAELLPSSRGSGEKKKPKKSQAMATSESDDNAAGAHMYKSDLAKAEEIKKSKGLSMWKTWERSSKKKSDKTTKISIFGTSRKRNKKNENKKDSVDGETVSKDNKNADRMSDSTLKDLNIYTGTGSAIDRVDQTEDKPKQKLFKTAKSSTSSYENSSSRGASDVDYWGDKNRNSSPPVAKSAAFCIMRLEELERNIEKTIREKFPDVEPFLIRKRTPPDDSSRGSKSLPTTPSPKKKIFISHDNTDSSQREVTSTLRAASNKLGDVVGVTRYYDETFEESASPVMSPVVLRRFGARTRHASISPKIQRAKTAALYNSPSEMERVAECSTPLSIESPPNELVDQQHATTVTTLRSTKSMTSASTKQNRSFQNHGHQLVRQQRIELSESEEDAPPNSNYCAQQKDQSYQSSQTDKTEKDAAKGGVDMHSFDKPVIVPSYSAVFGSVSPKLKRHMHIKHGGESVDGDHRLVKGGASTKSISSNQRSESLDSAILKNSGGERKQSFTLGEAKGKQVKDNQRTQQPSSKMTTTVSSGQAQTSPSSVRERVANIMKTVSGGRGRGGEGGGGYPPPTNARALEQVNKLESTATDSASPKPGWLNSDSHLRSADTKQHGEATRKAKESPVTSPGTGRKHSTDHVIFGSPVALPCRLYSKSTSPPSPPERRKGTNNNNEHPTSNFDSVLHAHAQSNAGGVHERNVKRCQGQIDVSSNTPSSTHFKHVQGSTELLSDCLAESKRGVSDGNISVIDKSNRKCHKGDPITGDNINKSDKYSGVLLNSISDNDFSKNSSTSASYEKENSVKSVFQRDLPSSPRDGQNDNKVYEDEQPVIVLKQPVSKVISDMINNSKQKQKHQQQQRPQQDKQHEQLREQQQQQQRNWQASPTTPEKDAIHVEPAFAMVTAPSFQQTCLALEEKHVVNGSICVPSSCGARLVEDKRVEKKEEIPLRDEVMGKRSDGNDLKCAHVGEADADVKAATAGSSSETSEGSDLDRFLKTVKASENLSHSKPAKEMPHQGSIDDVEQNPPPPSPTAIKKVSEILEEDEEEDEIEGKESKITAEVARGEDAPRKEVNLALVRHNEMREFSDKVCQRLSDLLSSHTGSDEVFVGTDWREDDEEKDGDDKEDVFVENAQFIDKSHKFRDDLQEHWEDPGLLSELSEANVLEPLKKVKSVKDHILASEIRRSQFSTSSSLSTSTSSSSSSCDLFAPSNLPPPGRHNFEGIPKSKIDQEYYAKRKYNDNEEDLDDESRNGHQNNSRCYHSDDDVARGGGIPDYYDDMPLWKKRQKPPGQISIALAATRRRERRERWLKKRRRNRTDLVSTGSSDMGSQNSLKQDFRLFRGDSTGSCEYEEDAEVANALSSQRRAMGSGILCSPKYSKPIMPFLGSGQITRPSPPIAQEEIITAEKVAPRLTASFRGGGDDEDDIDDSWDKDSSTISRSTDHTLCDDPSKSLDTTDDLDDHRSSLASTEHTATTATTSATGSHSHLAIPGLEETFDELMSVKQILEELQDRTPATSANVSKSDTSKQSSESLNNTNKTGDGKFMPLTAENIKSMKEFYKDSSGNGRRSRMSNTDRTESDLDLFSEYRDDASTDSNLYADDEEDDDNNEPYATADDDVGGTTGGDDVEDFVVSCTFYNSNSSPLDHANDNKNGGILGGPSCGDSEATSLPLKEGNTRNNNSNDVDSNHNRLVRSAGASGYGRSNSAPGSRSGDGNQFSLARGASAAGYNSDEEFWAGRAAFERSYQQLETAAGAVSSTFQNAREQMIDIQQHLQALRRQMEGLQDDLTSTSYTLTPDFSAFDSK